jgi:hypothetical protein
VKKSYNNLVTIPEGKRQLGRHRRKRRGKIEAVLKEICGDVEIINCLRIRRQERLLGP